MIEKISDRLKGKTKWFDIIEVKGNSTPLSFKNNRLHSITERENTGFGVRVNLEGKTGFSYTNDINKIDEIAGMAINLSKYGDDEEFDLPMNTVKSFDPFDNAIEQFDINDEISKAENSISSILAHFPKATVDMGISRSRGTTRLLNSKGLDLSYANSYYSSSIAVTLINDDGTKIDVWDGKSSLAPASYTDLHNRIIQKIEMALKIQKFPSGKATVILTPKAFAHIISIVKGGFNAKSVWKGISPFADKIGKKIFNENLSLYDDPLKKDSPFSFPFDDEGVTARKKPLISKGKILRYITDLKHAEKLSIEPEGNAARGYSTLPAPSFSNTTIEGGKESYSSIISSIDKGILVDQFIGLGQSNTLTGDFSANLDMAYLVENGQTTGRVKDCMISDNLFDLLAGEVIISLERELSGATLAPYIVFPAVNYTC